jgi:polynucleotide 5'-kinase involved in rRNA processing
MPNLRKRSSSVKSPVDWSGELLVEPIPFLIGLSHSSNNIFPMAKKTLRVMIVGGSAVGKTAFMNAAAEVFEGGKVEKKQTGTKRHKFDTFSDSKNSP